MCSYMPLSAMHRCYAWATTPCILQHGCRMTSGLSCAQHRPVLMMQAASHGEGSRAGGSRPNSRRPLSMAELRELQSGSAGRAEHVRSKPQESTSQAARKPAQAQPLQQPPQERTESQDSLLEISAPKSSPAQPAAMPTPAAASTSNQKIATDRGSSTPRQPAHKLSSSDTSTRSSTNGSTSSHVSDSASNSHGLPTIWDAFHPSAAQEPGSSTSGRRRPSNWQARNRTSTSSLTGAAPGSSTIFDDLPLAPLNSGRQAGVWRGPGGRGSSWGRGGMQAAGRGPSGWRRGSLGGAATDAQDSRWVLPHDVLSCPHCGGCQGGLL